MLKRKAKRGGLGRSLSGIYKALRKDNRISNIGNYQLMSFILRNTQTILPEHKWTRNQVLYSLTFCDFWKEEELKQKRFPVEWEKYCI